MCQTNFQIEFACLSVHPSVRPSVCPSVCLSVRSSVSVCLSVRPSFCLSVCLSVCPSVYLSVSLSNPKFCLSFCPSAYLLGSLFVSLSDLCIVFLCVCLLLALYRNKIIISVRTWQEYSHSILKEKRMSCTL